MDPKIVKKAVESAEKELQEKEISKIKNIAKSYLEKIAEKTKERSVIDGEIKDLKKDLDDLKSGRLDKIEERQSVNPEAKKHSLIIVTRIVEKYYPAQPWYSQYHVQYITPTYRLPGSYTNYSSAGGSYLAAGTNLMSSGVSDVMYCASTSSEGITGPSATLNWDSQGGNFSATGKAFQNFIGGAYRLGSGDCVNL